ncbi:MAG: N-acetyl sugar amidotransferase [Chitinophagaceae bacterium]
MIEYNEDKLREDLQANGGRPYQQCSISVLDTISDPGIRFDSDGVSNYYQEYKVQEQMSVFQGKEGTRKLEEMIAKIKEDGKGKKYDCITGVSGGVDSTYLVYLAKQYGLRVLVVHFDNGWNSEIAVKNIENIISNLGFDLYTLVVNWEEFRDIQLSYFKADVVDIEAITDHAIIATMYRLAIENNLKYILSGTNIVTEATLPRHWIFNKVDHKNIQSIHRKYGTIPLKTYPFFNTRLKKMAQLRGIESLSPLNLVEYNKAQIKETISRELGWKDYGGKHYESIFTRFYQGYILPVKFGIDKRKAHLSNLIFSGQISKADALEELAKPNYNRQLLVEDKTFVLKKLGFTEKEFDEYLLRPRKEHHDFDVEKGIFEEYPLLKVFKPFVRILQKLNG